MSSSCIISHLIPESWHREKVFIENSFCRIGGSSVPPPLPTWESWMWCYVFIVTVLGRQRQAGPQAYWPIWPRPTPKLILHLTCFGYCFLKFLIFFHLISFGLIPFFYVKPAFLPIGEIKQGDALRKDPHVLGVFVSFFENKEEGSRQLAGYEDWLPRMSQHGLVILGLSVVFWLLIKLDHFRELQG